MPWGDAAPAENLAARGERAMRICNACRYCEGFCAVFPAMERRLSFSPQDLRYLANLCHDCRECYDACQYAPPHEFALDLPRVLAELRRDSYRRFAWPSQLARALGGERFALALSLLLCPAALLVGALLAGGPASLLSAQPMEPGAFYRVVPYEPLAIGFGAAGAWALLALALGFGRFWRDAGSGSRPGPGALARALRDAATLRYLHDDAGCAYPGSRERRRYHHLTFYGFALCFAATTVAALYHHALGWQAPYPLLSLPVLLGTAGGIGLVVGPVGLLRLADARDPGISDPAQRRMDACFLVLLLLSSATGLLLLGLRETAAMGTLLVVHLGVVLGLFLTLPYGKFVHGIYRFAALVRYAKEERDS